MAIDSGRIEAAVAEILLAIGEDPARAGLVSTPRRVAEAYTDFFAGLDENPLDHLSGSVEFEAGSTELGELVLLRDIEFRSICEHHLLPFVGIAHVAYAPGTRIVGLGKGEDNIDRSVAVSPDGTQLWVAWKKEGERWHSAHKHAQGSFALISSMTDVVIKKHARENIVKATASWRYNQPSDSQISFGRKLRVYEEGMNRGKLSDAINQKLVMDAISRNSQKVAA